MLGSLVVGSTKVAPLLPEIAAAAAAAVAATFGRQTIVGVIFLQISRQLQAA